MKVIQSIQRAVDIINCFNEKDNFLSLNEISETLDLNINTVRGIMNTLVHNNLITHNIDSNKYSLGSFYIHKANLLHLDMIDKIKTITSPYLKKLAEKYSVSSRLQIVTGSEIVTVKSINPKNAYYILTAQEYSPLPLYATSSGKLFLKYTKNNKIIKNINFEKFTENTVQNLEELNRELDKIEVDGYSSEFEEVGLGVSSVAIPIFKSDNSLFGTISLTGITPVINTVLEDSLKEMKEYRNIFIKKLYENHLI